MSLLQRRKYQRDYEIHQALSAAKAVEASLTGSASEIRRRVSELAEAVTLANIYTRLVEDLEDVEKYGPNGR